MNLSFIFALFAMLALSAFGLRRPPSEEEQPIMYTFEQFKVQFNKSYTKWQIDSVRKTYQKNLARIETHNAKKGITYKLGVNEFADIDEDKIYIKDPLQNEPSQPSSPQQNIVVNKPLPTSAWIDWEKRGKVTPVKNQGFCNSCYAFASLAAFESAILKAEGKVTDLSEQQIIDCSQPYGNSGCRQGGVASTFQYLKNHAVASQHDYPYASHYQAPNSPNKPCLKPNLTNNKGSVSYLLKGYANITKGSCRQLELALRDGPVVVKVSTENWKFYHSGIFADCTPNIGHSVLLVGAHQNYWRIKNSWGERWGEKGYIRLARGNTCGICNQASYPIYMK